MQTVLVTVHSLDEDIPSFKVNGTVPFAGSPLAVTHVTVWDAVRTKWREAETFQIVHISTGYQLGCKEFDTASEAMAFLMLCEPDFPAWPLAMRVEGDLARMACHQKFKLAEQQSA